MKTAEEQRDWLLKELRSLAEWGIFPQARSGAYGILKNYHEKVEKANADAKRD